MLQFNVNNQIIIRKDDFQVVADSIDYLKAQFTMTDEWAEDTIAVFCGGDEVCHIILSEGGCTVPSQVIKAPGFSVSLFCSNKGLVTANIVWVEVCPSGICPQTEPLTPEIPLWQQYVERMHLMIESGLPFIGENGRWFLFDPEKGDYEDTGIQAEGKHPVKGVDYWNDEDKTEIINDVLSALPDADKMTFPLERAVSEVSAE